MDIDAISGPKTEPSTPPSRTEYPNPVDKSRMLPIRQRASAYEDYYRWDIRDKITISPEARRRYKRMLAKEKNTEEK
jgi:hypothetical protein